MHVCQKIDKVLLYLLHNTKNVTFNSEVTANATIRDTFKVSKLAFVWVVLWPDVLGSTHWQQYPQLYESFCSPRYIPTGQSKMSHSNIGHLIWLTQSMSLLLAVGSIICIVSKSELVRPNSISCFMLILFCLKYCKYSVRLKSDNHWRMEHLELMP